VISESYPQPSHQGEQLTELIGEINAVLAKANLTPNPQQSAQLVQALEALYGYNGIVSNQILNNIVTAAGSKLPNFSINQYPGSTTAPGTTLLSNCPRGEYLTNGYYADSPLGSNVASYGIIVTGNSNIANAPTAEGLDNWFYQEFYDMTGYNSGKRGTKYYRTNINGQTYGAWNAEHQTSLGNMFGYQGPDIVLPVGQSVLYDTGTIPVASLPLKLSCKSNQLYELEVVHKNPIVLSPSSYPIVNAAHTQLNLDLAIRPNNSDYINSFSVGSVNTIVNYYSSNGQIYNVSNPNAGPWQATTQTGIPYTTAVSGPYAAATNYPYSANFNAFANNNFWFDDVGGGVNPPYIRKILLYTGDQNNLPTAFHVGGGGSDSYQIGVNTSTSVWSLYNQIGYYTSLGTLYMPVGGQNAFLVSVRRII
jgi:hypothetical protein